MSLAETEDIDDLDTVEGAELADELRDEPEPERLSVRDAIEKSWKEHGGELPESRQEKQAKNSDRDATGKGAPGKFGSKSEPNSPVPPTEGQGAEAAPQPAVSAPNGWSKEAKAEWGKLPAAVQAAVTKREADMTAGAKQLQERYGGIHRVVTNQLAPAAQKYGLTPDRVFENMASWFHEIEKNPAAGLAALARVYKLDASKLGAAAPAPAANASNGQSPQTGDPRVDQLARTVAEMQQNRNQEAQQATLKGWSATKPHFQKVRGIMAQIVAGAAQMQDNSILDAAGEVDLDKVYDKAIWLDPEVRAAVLKEQAEERRKTREAQVTQARRAGSSVRPGTPGAGSARNDGAKKLPKGSPVREHIKAAMAELRS